MTLTWTNVVSTEPAAEPVTLADAKRNADIDHWGNDADVMRWITVARRRVENDTRRALVTQTRKHIMHEFPGGDGQIVLPYPPLSSVTSVAYKDTAGSSQTASTDLYEVDTNRRPGVIWLKYAQSWPATQTIQNAVTITYVCGYGNSSSVPEEAKEAIYLVVRQLHDQEMDYETPGFERAYAALIGQLSLGVYP